MTQTALGDSRTFWIVSALLTSAERAQTLMPNLADGVVSDLGKAEQSNYVLITHRSVQSGELNATETSRRLAEITQWLQSQP
jgi:hypothetical protein